MPLSNKSQNERLQINVMRYDHINIYFYDILTNIYFIKRSEYKNFDGFSRTKNRQNAPPQQKISREIR